jgi:uncharacterized membrane protein YkgB
VDLRAVDEMITEWLGRYGLRVLRYSVGVIFIWFGALKVFAVSPATELVSHTVYWVDPTWFVPVLGLWEVVIGICFLFRPLLRVGIGLLLPQILGTFLPLILLPNVVFQGGNVFVPTLEGQYIIKNLLIIGAAMVIGATVRKSDEKL